MESLQDRLNDRALTSIIELLCNAIPQYALQVGPIAIDKKSIIMRLMAHKGEMKEWLIENRKDLLQNLIQLTL